MPLNDKPAALVAADAPPRTKPGNYPEPFASRMTGRVKRPLDNLFDLTNFGVNLTYLPPGAVSALHHRHSRQDEFIDVLEGEPTLVTDAGGAERGAWRGRSPEALSTCREAPMPDPWTKLWSASNPWGAAGSGWPEFERQMTEMLFELTKQAVAVWMSALMFWMNAFRLPTTTRRSDRS
jgi:hypothetical protein